MVVDDRSRYELHQKLDQVLGTEAASTLMAHLPPVGWADVATKHDLAQRDERLELRLAVTDARIGTLNEAVDARFEGVDARFEAVEARIEGTKHEVIAVLRGELAAHTRTIDLALVMAIIGSGGLAVAASRLG